MTSSRANLAELGVGDAATIEYVGGERAFRRRLMELGLVPGTRVALIGIAPLGDPLELLVRGASLSIRKSDALQVSVSLAANVAGEQSSQGERVPVELAGSAP